MHNVCLFWTVLFKVVVRITKEQVKTSKQFNSLLISNSLIHMANNILYGKLYVNMTVLYTLPIVGAGTAKPLDKGHLVS